QTLLGHAKLDTTALYARVANTTIRAVTSPLDRLAPLIKGRPRSEAGGRRRLSSPWGRLAPGQRRTCEPGSAPGHVGDRAVPLGRARRACRVLRGLWPQPHRLQLVPQSPLPKVPGCGGNGLARSPRGRPVAGRLFC